MLHIVRPVSYLTPIEKFRFEDTLVKSQDIVELLLPTPKLRRIQDITILFDVLNVNVSAL